MYGILTEQIDGAKNRLILPSNHAKSITACHEYWMFVNTYCEMFLAYALVVGWHIAESSLQT